MGNELPLFSKENLPVTEWQLFQKKSQTRAVRIDGPFRVETSETENEPFLCQDGWLALDARGYPYAIADDEFQMIYQPVE